MILTEHTWTDLINMRILSSYIATRVKETPFIIGNNCIKRIANNQDSSLVLEKGEGEREREREREEGGEEEEGGREGGREGERCIKFH